MLRLAARTVRRGSGGAPLLPPAPPHQYLHLAPPPPPPGPPVLRPPPFRRPPPCCPPAAPPSAAAGGTTGGRGGRVGARCQGLRGAASGGGVLGAGRRLLAGTCAPRWQAPPQYRAPVRCCFDCGHGAPPRLLVPPLTQPGAATGLFELTGTQSSRCHTPLFRGCAPPGATAASQQTAGGGDRGRGRVQCSGSVNQTQHRHARCACGTCAPPFLPTLSHRPHQVPSRLTSPRPPTHSPTCSAQP